MATRAERDGGGEAVHVTILLSDGSLANHCERHFVPTEAADAGGAGWRCWPCQRGQRGHSDGVGGFELDWTVKKSSRNTLSTRDKMDTCPSGGRGEFDY